MQGCTDTQRASIISVPLFRGSFFILKTSYCLEQKDISVPLFRGSFFMGYFPNQSLICEHAFPSPCLGDLFLSCLRRPACCKALRCTLRRSPCLQAFLLANPLPHTLQTHSASGAAQFRQYLASNWLRTAPIPKAVFMPIPL